MASLQNPLLTTAPAEVPPARPPAVRPARACRAPGATGAPTVMRGGHPTDGPAASGLTPARGFVSRAPAAALLAACSIWGAAFYFAKLVLAEVGVVHLVFWRFALAAAVLTIVVARARIRPARRDWPLFALTGVLCVPVTYLLQFEGVDRTTVTSASLIVGTATPLLALAAALFDGERLGIRGWAAVAVSTLGVALMVGLPGAGHDPVGDALVFASIAVSVGWVLLSKRLMRRYPPAVVTAWILLLGTIALAPITVTWGGLPSVALTARAWLSLLALGLGCTVGAFILWNWGLQRMPSGRAGVYLNLEPVVGAALGVFLLGEALTAGTAAGGALVLGAAVAVSRSAG